MKWKSHITVLKGLWVGSTMTVPGVSGGTMAVVVDVYEDLLRAINEILLEPKKHVFFLLQFITGAGIGFVVFARLITTLLENTATGAITRLFFCGIVLGGIPLLVHKANVHKIKWNHIICLISGAAIVYVMALLPQGILIAESGVKFFLLQFMAGIIIAIALVLPGISVTHVLFVMGLYEIILEKIYELQFSSLIPLALGVVIGILLTTRLLEKGLKRFPEEMYMVIVGFVAASLSNLIPKGAVEMPIMGVLVGVCGFVAMYLTSKRNA